MYRSIGANRHALCSDLGVARVEIHKNEVLGLHTVPGLEVEADERPDGISAKIVVEEGTRIYKPVRVCFGMMEQAGLQRVELDVEIREGATVGVVAHCTFPMAEKIRHEMDASIKVAEGAHYAYIERHVHGEEGGVVVVPRTHVSVAEGGRYETEFELIKGRVGDIDLLLDGTVEARGVLEVYTRVRGAGDDRIRVDERGHLKGEHARGVLNSYIALRDEAEAEILNTLRASGAYARGHVDCKEIVQDDAVAKAVPVVEVTEPRAHVTHEAAIGSVDSRQLETLMSRGLTEDDATDLIIYGLLGGSRLGKVAV
jgi:hypothetical protein